MATIFGNGSWRNIGQLWLDGSTARHKEVSVSSLSHLYRITTPSLRHFKPSLPLSLTHFKTSLTHSRTRFKTSLTHSHTRFNPSLSHFKPSLTHLSPIKCCLVRPIFKYFGNFGYKTSYIVCQTKKKCYLCTALPRRPFILRRDGRVVDYSGLENRRTERYRGFESLSLRFRYSEMNIREKPKKNVSIIATSSYDTFLLYKVI